MTPFGRFRWRVFLALLGSTLACVIVFWALIPPTYLTNDDVGIRRDLEGLTAPDAVPTGYVLIAHSLLGWALVGLQRAVQVHIWDFVVGGLFILSIAVVLTGAWSIAAGAGRLLAVAAVLSVVAPLLAGMQVTISATLAGSAAMITAAMELQLPAPRRSVLVASAVLLVLGLLVRPMGAAAGGLLAVGLLMPLAVCDRQLRSIRLGRLGIAAAALAVSAGALVYLDGALYQLSPAWGAYQQDNWMTARLFEWGGDLPASVVEPLRTQLGWTANDWELLRRFWGVDPGIHSHARIEMLYGAWSALVDWRLRLGWLMGRTVADLTGATFLRLFSQSAIAMAAAALVAVALANRRGVAALTASTAIFFAACIAMEIGFKELPFRLFAPLQVCFVLAVLVTSRALNRPARTLLTALCAAAACVLLVREARAAGSDALADSRQSRDVDAQVSELLQLHPSLLVLHADSFPSEHWWRPFHTPPARLPAIQLGLNNHNPYVQRFLTRSYPQSLLRAICTDPSILVVGERGRLDPVTTFMHEHHGIEVEWTEVYAGSFRVWRCAPKGAR